MNAERQVEEALRPVREIETGLKAAMRRMRKDNLIPPGWLVVALTMAERARVALERR